MPDWSDRLQTSVDPEDAPSAYLARLDSWQDRTSTAAERHSRHATKHAVREVEPTPKEQRALSCLFALVSETIYYECQDVLRRFSTSQHADEPTVTHDDLLGEAWPLFLRSMVRYNGDESLQSLHQHVRRAFRDRVKDYVKSRLRHPVSEERPPMPDEDTAPIDVDLQGICEELQEEGVIPAIGAPEGG